MDKKKIQVINIILLGLIPIVHWEIFKTFMETLSEIDIVMSILLGFGLILIPLIVIIMVLEMVIFCIHLYTFHSRYRKGKNNLKFKTGLNIVSLIFYVLLIPLSNLLIQLDIGISIIIVIINIAIIIGLIVEFLGKNRKSI